MPAAPAPTAAEPPATPRAPASAWWGLAVLILVGLYVVMDRPVFTLQVETIRQQLQLSDLQIGLVSGLSVAVLVSVVGYPIAWMADRFDRRVVLSLCIAVWSASMVLMGLAGDFTALFVASALVGAGEAGLLPIAYSLIPELFKGPQRQLANSLLLVAGRFGAGFVIALCGYLVQYVDRARPWLPEVLQDAEGWRLAMFATAMPGVLLIVLVMTLRLPGVARPPRPPRTATERRPAPPVRPFLRKQAITFGSFYAGLGTLIFGMSAIGAFLPVVAMRQMGATAVQVGNGMGMATALATGIGLVVSTLGSRALARRLGERLPIVFLMVASLLAPLACLPMLQATTPTQLFVLFGALTTCVFTGSMMFPTALQDMSPQPLRTRLVSIVIIVNTVLSSLAPAVVGALSDQLKSYPDGLLRAAVGTAVVALVVSAAMLAWCSRHYGATVRAARLHETALQPPDAGQDTDHRPPV